MPTNGYVGNGCAVSPGPGERIHQVRPGDTLYGIAASSGVTIIAVRQRNGLTSDRIRVGECLIVPSGYVVTPVPDRRRDSERSQEAEGPLPVPSPVPVEPSTPRVSQSRG